MSCVRASLLVLASFSLVACSQPKDPDGAVSAPSPFDPERDALDVTTLPAHAVAADFPRLEVAAAGSVQPLNTTGHDQGGQAGFSWDESASDGQVHVEHTAYLSTYFGGSYSLPTPKNGIGSNVINMPTTHAGGALGCLEAVTSYSNGFSWTGKTRGQLQVYDFCNNGGSWGPSWDIDSTFLKKYVRVYKGSSYPKYIVEQRLISGHAHLLLYNVQTSAWDDFYTATTGANGRSDGWSIFETHFGSSGDPASATEKCPSGLPAANMSNLELHNAKGWFAVTAATLNSTPSGWGDCFAATKNVSPYFVFASDPKDSQWTVTNK